MPARYIQFLKGLKHKSKAQSREAKFFFFSQYFADGLRITLAILLPSLILSYMGKFQVGLVLSLGAFCVSIVDFPGPARHRNYSMFFCVVAIFMAAIATGFARMYEITMGLEIVLLGFFCSMLLVYGARAGAIGSAALLVMILTMDEPLKAAQVFNYALLILAGGCWYMLVSVLFSRIQPYRPAQRSLGECLHEIARFLKIKADFYDVNTSLDEDYRKLVAQHVIVSEKQDAVREMFFKSRTIVKEATSTSRLLILTFIEAVDLFEDISATYYDYTAIREKYAGTGLLEKISVIIKRLAVELDNIAFAIQANVHYKKQGNLDAALEELKLSIDALSGPEGTRPIVLSKILVNMRNLNHRLDNILVYFSAKPSNKVQYNSKIDHSQFVTRQRFDFGVIKENFSLKSGIFRHSLRMAIACLAGFMVAKFLAPGKHSYWILLTIAFILKPAFSLTKQRNIYRIIGTIVGGIIGVLILYFIKDRSILFAFFLLFMLGAYSFMRSNYILMVIFVTPYVLILFHFLGIGFVGVFQERIIDTVIGCGIAFSASYILFPSWESDQLKTLMINVLRANINYINKLMEILGGKHINIAEYKLARKDVYVSSANLVAAFQRMLTEPKNKQKNSNAVHQFVVVNHILSSNIASLTSGMLLKDRIIHADESLKPLKQSVAILTQSLKKLEPGYIPAQISSPASAEAKQKTMLTPDEMHLRDQLEFIHKVSHDIGKLTDIFLQKQVSSVTSNQ